MNQLTVIKNKNQYYKYCDELEQLGDSEKTSKAISNRMELLEVLIDKWDKENSTIPTLNPVEYLKLLMSTNNVKAVTIQKNTGIDKTVISHILAYRKKFSVTNIRLLADYFKVAQEGFNRPYNLIKEKPKQVTNKKANYKHKEERFAMA